MGAIAILLVPPVPEEIRAQNADAAQADGAGLARTVSSRGNEAGCLYWFYKRELTNNRKYPDRQRLTFTLRNDCRTTVYFAMASQTGWNDSAGYRNESVLAPGEIYSNNISTFIYTPSKDGYFNFWVFQSETPISFKTGNKPILTLCNPRHRKKENLVRENPPCPPHFTAS